MKNRFFASLSVLALIQLGSAATSSAQDPVMASSTAPVVVTTIKRTTVRVGNVSLPLNEGSRLEVLGREGDSLLVKFRTSKGKVPARDTDFNPATTNVTEIAPEPAAKSSDLTISSAAPVHDSSTQAPESGTAPQRVATANQSPQKASKPAKAPAPSAPPPPVNN